MESADVQLEHGYTRLANRLVEALSVAEFTGAQTKIVLAIWRDTYGWGQEAVRVALPALAAKCGAPFSGGFRRAFHELVDEGVVVCVVERGSQTAGSYMVQKNFSKWGRFSIAEGKLAALWDQRPEHVAVVKAPAKPEPEEPKPRRKAAEPSWPAKAVEIWAKERDGAVLAFGPAGKHLKPVVELLGQEEALERWARYCRETKGNGWSSPANFAAHVDEYHDSANVRPAATSMVR